MITLKYLYYFSSKDIDIVEVKRLDLQDAPLSEVYKWLIIKKATGKVWELDFKSMEQNEETGIRKFDEGLIHFDKKKATLSLFGEIIDLNVLDPDEVPEGTINYVKKHLVHKYPRTEKYYFRELKPSDLQFFYNWIFDKEVIRYSMTKFHRISSDEEVLKWFKSTLEDPKSFQLGIIDIATNKLIGYAGIAGLNEIDHNGEYFIFIGNKKHWGKGIASDVTKKIIQIGFFELKLHRIFLTASNKNTGAIKAYEKAGFNHEGVMREAFFRGGEYSDKVIMGILQTEYFSDLEKLQIHQSSSAGT